jgi:hypothetical protein
MLQLVHLLVLLRYSWLIFFFFFFFDSINVRLGVQNPM